MKRAFLRLFVGIFAFTLMFFAVACADADDGVTALPKKTELFAQTAKGVVLVSALDLSGSGIVVKSDGQNVEIMTNFHVVKNAIGAKGQIFVKLFGADEFIEAAVEGYVEEYDICLLSVAYEGSVDTFDLAQQANEQIGQELLDVGFSGGKIGAYEGIISMLSAGIFSKSLNRHMIVNTTTVPFLEGCSGGAVVDSLGRLAGMSSYVLLTNYDGQSLHTGLSYIIPTSIIRAAYERIALSSAVPSRPACGFVVNADYSVTVVFGNYLFRVVEENNYIRVIESQSGGIVVGARIEKINGVELRAENKMTVFLSEVLRTYDATVFVTT